MNTREREIKDSETRQSFKIVLIGNPDLKLKFLKEAKEIDTNKSTTKYRSTIGVDFINVQVNDANLQVWDVSSNSRFFSMYHCYLRNADAAIYLEATHEQIQAAKAALPDKCKVHTDFTSGQSALECLKQVTQALVAPVEKKPVKKIPHDPEFAAATTAIQLHNIL